MEDLSLLALELEAGSWQPPRSLDCSLFLVATLWLVVITVLVTGEANLTCRGGCTACWYGVAGVTS